MRRTLATLVTSLALTGCSVVGIRSGTEEPRFEVVARLEGGVEVRRYGPRLVAETVVPGQNDGEARGAAFRVLAGYIFGGNRGGAEIAMTAPVEVDGSRIAMTAPVETAPAATAAGEAGLVMRFTMPAGYTRATLPEPEDPRVRIVEVPEETVAVLGFTGSTAAAAMAAQEERLGAVLAGSPWQATGPAVALFYDPPWTLPFRRRNEVAVPVVPKS